VEKSIGLEASGCSLRRAPVANVARHRRAGALDAEVCDRA
jgi:hypothetical protein